MTKRKKIIFFVSYAHRNRVLANNFLEKLSDVLAPSKRFNYELWKDSAIAAGEDWEQQIEQAIEQCDFGLLLISPAFLASKYISRKELPAFVDDQNKPFIPVMLQQVDFARHDLKGLEKRQIFRLDFEGFNEPRAYGDCKGTRRETFVFELFRAIEDRLG